MPTYELWVQHRGWIEPVRVAHDLDEFHLRLELIERMVDNREEDSVLKWEIRRSN